MLLILCIHTPIVIPFDMHVEYCIFNLFLNILIWVYSLLSYLLLLFTIGLRFLSCQHCNDYKFRHSEIGYIKIYCITLVVMKLIIIIVLQYILRLWDTLIYIMDD